MTNRLVEAKSLYLRKHAENPIDWWPWCDEALGTAKEKNLPIFLSIGYSSCHWCTVMEGEAFSDLTIAEYMNANFLPIKVDREERPDIDSIYMQALQMMSGQGGWPLNVFLSPDDLVPFYAGTYFPLEPRYGRPGFLQVLQALRRYYDTEKDDLQQRKAAMVEALLTSAVLKDGTAANVAEQELLRKAWETCTAILTPNQSGNSFPMIPYGELVSRLNRFNFSSRYDGTQVVTQRGLDLALGGIYDHVGGGFHRYTVDPTWTVPHFEKMLYDNGQIVEYLANLWSVGLQEPAFERAIAKTVQWLKREMTAPEGYFYAAQDADSFIDPSAAEPEEGAFYVWSYSELSQILAHTELTELQKQFTITLSGNFESQNVLQRLQAGQLSESVEVALDKLFAERYGNTPESLETFPPARDNQEAKTYNWPGRIPSVTDTKMIVAWNSLMISGLARAAVVFQQLSYLELAAKAANFILAHQFVDGRFHRLNYDKQPHILAQSEDYAFFIKALLDLHQASLGMGDVASASLWQEKAIALQDEFNEFLWSVELGGYYNAAIDASQDLIVRERSYVDNATPSANGIAIANLVRLTLLTDNLHYLNLAEQGLKAFKTVMARSPQACPSLFTALDWYRNSTIIRSNTEQIKSLMPKYLPTVVFAAVSNLPENTIGLVCQGLKCLAPAQSIEQLWQQVQQSQSRG
ncbi:thioredoxin domain-containing protein [Calothrix sp. FACHB-1219]|uniref:thioredoxin domain-containing protein n=1 Tax=unclassified Calothrix TaxID=2619626 RepID=UPI00168943D5|nr:MULTISPECIES: thioredoxin domain-containing protein [unclassified Calothrix]MBD2201446.1 thioredoxin domain-containing protein [Calothrix sp. FACHB-168]MBD2215878.1 thioredoxin domain-containing protein [Calothrix sp. FACHB-1219]